MRVELLGVTYNIRDFGDKVPAEGNLLGLWDSSSEVIYLKEGMPRGQRRCTFLHEILHMVDDRMDVGINEKQTNRMATGLLGVRIDGRGIIRL